MVKSEKFLHGKPITFDFFVIKKMEMTMIKKV